MGNEQQAGWRDQEEQQHQGQLQDFSPFRAHEDEVYRREMNKIYGRMAVNSAIAYLLEERALAGYGPVPWGFHGDTIPHDL